MQDEEKESENSELFEDCFDEVLHKNSYDFWLFDLISVSLALKFKKTREREILFTSFFNSLPWKASRHHPAFGHLLQRRRQSVLNAFRGRR